MYATKCSVCGELATLIEHQFKEGPAHKPHRGWSYWAALYHHPETKASYCSPACATKALGRAEPAPQP